jgi:hypothetical protein
MPKFTDTTGREWKVEITIATVKRVRNEFNDVDLVNIFDGGLLQRLANDPVLLCDVLYVICKPQAVERGVTDEQFGEAMGGDTIENATSAFMEGLTAFFHGPRRMLLGKMKEKTDQLEKLGVSEIAKRLDGDELDNQIRKIANMPIGLSSTLPPLPESTTPDH